jgi:hypothetical protein
MKKILSTLLTAALVAQLACPALAAGQTEVEAAGAYLKAQGVLQGDESGDLMLDKGLSRVELAVILTRLMGNPEHIAAETDYYASQCGFSDVPPWAQVYVGYCVSNVWMIGYGGDVFGTYDSVTPEAACTVMLRYMEIPSEDWTYDTAVSKAAQLGLVPDSGIGESAVTRGDMAILLYRAMGNEYSQANGLQETQRSGLSYNSDGSINPPSDGSRYVPQAGDVIRCDDGSNYTITDVSRYDKNMFASGPVGDLPDPTCDWSSFPETELPSVEARRFQLEHGDYLFIRNLYESLRMQYTIQNLAGNHPETSENGKLRCRSDGTPTVRINLTIDDSLTAQSFWPWRDSELKKIFESCPSGTYSMEAWDVYADGIFLYTEYKVHVS